MLASRSSFRLVSPREVDRLPVLAREHARQQPQLVAGERRDREHVLVAEELAEEPLQGGDARALFREAERPPRRPRTRRALAVPAAGRPLALELVEQPLFLAVVAHVLRQLHRPPRLARRRRDVQLPQRRLLGPVEAVEQLLLGLGGLALGEEDVERGVAGLQVGVVAGRAVLLGGEEGGRRARVVALPRQRARLAHALGQVVREEGP